MSDSKKKPRRSRKYAIETYDLWKTYKTAYEEVHALHGIDLKIKNGEMVAVVGPSGSGKSTLLNMIGALDRPSKGRILIDNTDITRLKESTLAKFRNRKVGFVFQTYNLIARSKVEKNIELPAIMSGATRKARKNRVNDLLELVGLGGMQNRKPNTLSGGQQQRVAIARALVNDPTFILADEPTGNLDSKTGDEIANILIKINQERKATIVIVTHDLELADKTQRILHLRDGKVEKETEGFSYPIKNFKDK
jgi:putative ABC transport system ATP-binding protein